MRTNRRPRRIRRRLLALVAGFVFATLLVEVAIRITGVAPAVGPLLTQWDAQDGRALKPGFHCMRYTPEFEMEFTTNSEGFRGPELPQRIDRSILCLGDSFTMGYGVGDGAEFPALVRQRAPSDWTVVNAGIINQGNGRWIRFLERERAQPRLRPRIVILQFCGNDFGDNLRENLYSLEAGQLVAHSPRPESFLRTAQMAIDEVPGLRYSHLIAFARHAHSVWMKRAAGEDEGAARSEGPHPGRELLHAIVVRAVVEARAIGADVLAVACELPDAEVQPLHHLLDKEGVRLLVVPRKEEQPSLYHAVDGHWTAAGHALVASMVVQELQSERYGLGATGR